MFGEKAWQIFLFWGVMTLLMTYILKCYSLFCDNLYAILKEYRKNCILLLSTVLFVRTIVCFLQCLIHFLRMCVTYMYRLSTVWEYGHMIEESNPGSISMKCKLCSVVTNLMQSVFGCVKGIWIG